jgi:predicted metal-binding protein
MVLSHALPPHDSSPPDSPIAQPPATLFVCIACRRPDDPDGAPRAGKRLHEALIAAQGGDCAFRTVPVECLSNCNRACSVAFAGPARWTYVYGDLSAETAADVLTGAARYAATTDGVVPWRELPAALRRGLTARVPPLAVSA